MPTYKNTSSNTIVLSESSFNPGQTKKVYQYLYHPSLTFISHDPRIYPWKELYAGNLPSGVLANIEQYKKIKIVNGTTGVVHLRANNDVSNNMAILSGETIVIELENDITSITLTGTGTGNVYAYGFYDNSLNIR